MFRITSALLQFLFLQKAIDESETEWSHNKKLIDLAKKSGDIRKAIPKGFSYFAVDFGLQAGYAHIIEDEGHFPNYFAHVCSDLFFFFIFLLIPEWRHTTVYWQGTAHRLPWVLVVYGQKIVKNYFKDDFKEV